MKTPGTNDGSGLSPARAESGTEGAGEYRIRKAVPEDEGRIRELFEEMLRTIYHTDSEEGYENGYLDKYWRGGEDIIFVAEDPRDVAAFLSVEVYRRPEEYVYLDDLSVTASCRNKGIGTALIQTAEAYAAKLRISVIVFHVLKSNAQALRLYKRLGYFICRDEGSRYLMGKDLSLREPGREVREEKDGG